MKRILNFSLFMYLAFSAVLLSCNKDSLEPSKGGIIAKEKISKGPLTVSLGKEYYNDFLINTSVEHTEKSTKSSRQNIQANKFSKQEPVFSEALELESSIFYYLEMPLISSKRHSFSFYNEGHKQSTHVRNNILNASFERLVIYKDKQTGVLNQRIITFVPDPTCLSIISKDVNHNRTGKLDPNFSGWLVYQTWSRANIFALKIKNGKAVGRIKFNDTNHTTVLNNKNSNEPSYAGRGCEQVWVEIYDFVCYYPGMAQNPKEEVCIWDETGRGEWQYLCDGEDEDEDGDPTCYDTGDCEDWEDWDSGNNGVESSPTVILNTSLTPCQTTVLNRLASPGSNGMLAFIVQKFGGNTSGYNWRLVNGSLPSGTFGSTGPYDRIHRVITSTFDARQMGNATDLSVARTMLHESVHAYLMTYFANSPQYANTSYPDLVAAYAAAGVADPNIPHHNVMGQTGWLGDLAWALKQYGINRGYNLSDQYYADMAWGGLEASQAFQALPQADQTRIANLLRVEATGKDSQGNSQPQSGQSAGCP